MHNLPLFPTWRPCSAHPTDRPGRMMNWPIVDCNCSIYILRIYDCRLAPTAQVYAMQMELSVL